MKFILAVALSALMNPDYSSVTVPENIAPLNFEVRGASRVCARFESEGHSISVKGREVCTGVRKWHRFMDVAGDTVRVSVRAKMDGQWRELEPFEFYKAESADPCIAYRLIEPGYEVWNEMGIYQRNIANFSQKAIITNRTTGNNCMNCHSFCNRQPDRMVFHMRGANGGTYLIREGVEEKLNTKTDSTISALVYPQWHPSGRFIAFSVNTTNQMFHTTDPDRIEVYDSASDVVVYDVENHEIFSCPQLKGDWFETYPTFSPDGNKLYFCTSRRAVMPIGYEKVHYSLCSIGFDPSTRSFSDRVDTLYNARTSGGSVSLPRVSPDGKFLMFTLQSYGNFGIWHKDSDLYILDLADGGVSPCTQANSPDVDSYHSWSSNSRWVLFSSRRDDGLYTRLYLARVAEDGSVSKAFLLPQKRSSYYKGLLKSYNIPEFAAFEPRTGAGRISRLAKRNPGINITYSKR